MNQSNKHFDSYFIFMISCGTIPLRHSLIILPAGILLVKMYAWSSYPAGSELCRNRTGLRFSVRSFGCALFYYIPIEIRKFRKRAILMALIKCPDCGKNVSNRAPACIYSLYSFSTIGSLASNRTISFTVALIDFGRYP